MITNLQQQKPHGEEEQAFQSEMENPSSLSLQQNNQESSPEWRDTAEHNNHSPVNTTNLVNNINTVPVSHEDISEPTDMKGQNKSTDTLSITKGQNENPQLPTSEPEPLRLEDAENLANVSEQIKELWAQEAATT